ncbi:MAG: hypothetical protein NUV67_03695 [archaeon]|nr:hypothetical protein [archaeon]
MIWLELLLASVMSILHFYSESVSAKVERFHNELVSFSAGLFITQIFFYLMPEFFKGTEILGDNVFLLLLFGFVSFHLAEKYVYQHVKNKNKLLKDLGEIHAAGFFIDHFVVGMALVFAFSTTNVIFGLLIFIPLLLHTLSSSIAMTHIDEHFDQSKIVNSLLSIAPLLGVIFAGLLNPDRLFYHVVFSFVIGALLYVVIRDMLPQKEEGNSRYFLYGFATSLIIFVVLKGLLT